MFQVHSTSSTVRAEVTGDAHCSDSSRDIQPSSCCLILMVLLVGYYLISAQ